MANWFMYLMKTPISQMRSDWRCCRALEKALSNAWNEVQYAREQLVHSYDIEDDMRQGDACIKRKMMLSMSQDGNQEQPVYRTSRCQNFQPVNDEVLCPVKRCDAWARNNKYFENKAFYQELKAERASYWKNKFANVK